MTLVDLPSEQQRSKILALHLSKEKLDSSVSIDNLAKRTALYSGSDLKNMAVSAALTAVKEAVMRELLGVPGTELSRGEILTRLDSLDGWSVDALVNNVSSTSEKVKATERVLYPEHFEVAFNEIPPSLSDDTQTLIELRKWDAQFGDAAAKGRGERRRGWGFSTASPLSGGEKIPNSSDRSNTTVA